MRSETITYDQPLLCAIFILLIFGLIMVYSASIALPDAPKYAKYNSNHFLIYHATSIAIACIAGLFSFYYIPIRTWNLIAPSMFIFSTILLILVLSPGIGKEVNGARRWISFSFINFQPSELMKLAVVIFSAYYTVKHQEHFHSFIRGLIPMSVAVMFVGGLLLLQPDMGAFLVIAIIAMGILFLGGIKARSFGTLISVALIAFISIIILSPFRRERIFAYLDPWKEDYVAGKSYQLIHSLMAFGRGEWFGMGLGGSVEKLHYLPEAHTDFILAVIGEELGFIGVTTVIVIFYWIVRRAFLIGRTALLLDHNFAGLVSKGIAIWIGWQGFINMGVNLGILPTKGLTLPLVSFGGSGILINVIAMSILLRIDYENRILMHGFG